MIDHYSWARVHRRDRLVLENKTKEQNGANRQLSEEREKKDIQMASVPVTQLSCLVVTFTIWLLLLNGIGISTIEADLDTQGECVKGEEKKKSEGEGEAGRRRRP